jgi:hypothetical protein
VAATIGEEVILRQVTGRERTGRRKLVFDVCGGRKEQIDGQPERKPDAWCLEPEADAGKRTGKEARNEIAIPKCDGRTIAKRRYGYYGKYEERE